jgi:molybdenum cofactor biosynthesis protein B
MPLDPSRAFRPVRLAVLTVSDTRSLKDDPSGDLLVSKIEEAGHQVVARALCRDEGAELQAQLRTWVADPGVEVVITVGGTGVTGRDVTPEALAAVWDKEIPGFGELFRWISFQSVGTSTIQSRATAGIARGTLLFALPGSRGAVKDAWDGILVHQLDSRHRPCNFVELMPRFLEHVPVGEE